MKLIVLFDKKIETKTCKNKEYGFKDESNIWKMALDILIHIDTSSDFLRNNTKIHFFQIIGNWNSQIIKLIAKYRQSSMYVVFCYVDRSWPFAFNIKVLWWLGTNPTISYFLKYKFVISDNRVNPSSLFFHILVLNYSV